MLTLNKVTTDIRCTGKSSLEGDYLASRSKPVVWARVGVPTKIDIGTEVNLAENAEAYAAGKHQGFEPTAWDGLLQSIDVIAQKQTKVVISGGGLNPKGLALEIAALSQGVGIPGRPPPPTTKLAIFYGGGYQSQLLMNAAGYGTDEKWELQEKQIHHSLKKAGLLDKFDVPEFQVQDNFLSVASKSTSHAVRPLTYYCYNRVGTPEPNPSSQLRSTTCLQISTQADDPALLVRPIRTLIDYDMQYFSGTP
ncbi:MAG: hypothetical protein M1839_002398 [Geoglossum umbratile]|nr:MAG: hypothetical protein M1839_002398 [Geoglossum umbratile]